MKEPTIVRLSHRLGMLSLAVVLGMSGTASAQAPKADALPAPSDGQLNTNNEPVEVFDTGATVGTKYAPTDPFESDATVTAKADAGAKPAATPSAKPAAMPADDDAAKAARRARKVRAQNTLRGAVGGIHVVDAGSGPAGSFRLQLHTGFFMASDFLNDGDTNDNVGGALSISASITDFLEVYAAIGTGANTNNTESPELFQVLGDTNLGVKGFFSATPWLTVGGDLEIALLNGVGDLGLSLKGTSVGIRGNATADFRDLTKPFPLIARFNLQYFVDNSANLIKDVENIRYDALVAPAPKADESRHLLTRVERFALGINRTDFLNLALGVEAPLEVTKDFVVSPILEWTWGIPINRQGYDCLYIPSKGVGTPSNPQDSCLDSEGVKAFPMDLTLGVRVAPPVPGLSLFAGVDIGLTGTGHFVRELAGNAPYNVMLGLGYAYDTGASREQVVKVSEVVVTQAPEGHVRGTVVEKDTNPPTPVPGAVIHFLGDHSGLTAQLAGADGKFTSYSLPEGDVHMEVSHKDYETGTCDAKLPPDGDVDVTCSLVAKPRGGVLSGRITDDGGSGVEATITYSGPGSGTFKTESNGMFEATSLPAGLYTAQISAPNCLAKADHFEVRSEEPNTFSAVLTRKASKPAVEVQDGAIKLKRQINFATGSDEINPNSEPLLAEIADAILRNPDIKLIEIQGHTDNVGGAEKNKSLSQKRAQAVRASLIEKGVEADRLEAKGYGLERPIAPNITAVNRAKNRRVEFIILLRQGRK